VLFTMIHFSVPPLGSAKMPQGLQVGQLHLLIIDDDPPPIDALPSS
jgi:hypothetical protein